MTFRYKVIKPGWSEDCYCGSSQKFGVCCRARLPGFSIGKKYSEACEANNWEAALLQTRADITQYTIWHKSHVEPVVDRMTDRRLLMVDVDALAGYVERLQWLYLKTGRESTWLATLERLHDNIKQRPWRRKLAYLRTIFFLRPESSTAEARRELKKLGPIPLDETDIELLQLFIDLELEHLPFSERLKYADRLLELSPSLSDQMQYRCVKAVQYFLIGDRKSSEGLFAEVVAMGRCPDNQPLERYEHHLLARAVQHLGMLRNDATSLNESIALFNDLMLDDDWTPIGRAALTSEIGQSYKFLEDWSGAEKSHLDAIKLHDNAVDRIHLAEALLYQKKVAEACVAIDHLDATTLTGSALEDFALAYAVIAIWHGDKHRLQCALGHLESYQPEEPYFRERRLQLLRSVDKGIVKGKISETEILESTPKGGFLALMSKIIMIQPNLGGFGLNFNALMDEIAKRKELDKRPRPERKRDDG